MYLCIPVDDSDGNAFQLSLHFGTAPKLVVVNLETEKLSIFDNPDPEHRDLSRLLFFFKEHGVTHVAVGGVSLEILDELQRSGVSVFSSAEDTVPGIVRAFKEGTVNPVTLGSECGRRSSGGRGFSMPGCGGGYGRGGGCTGGC